MTLNNNSFFEVCKVSIEQKWDLTQNFFGLYIMNKFYELTWEKRVVEMKGKRILLCCNRTLGIGGIEKSLTTFVKELDTENNRVTLVLSNSSGELFQQLPTENIQIVYTGNINTSEMLKDDIKHFRIAEIAKGAYNRIMLRLNHNWYARIMYTYRIIQRKLQFQEPFDCAISFTTDYSDLSMALAANTDKHVAFVHADATQNPYIATLNDHLLRQFDKIYCVSENSKELFLKVHPDCVGAMDIFRNIVDVDEIRRQGGQPVEDMVLDGIPTLCTVGRLSQEKGQMLIPETASLLRKEGYLFRWYLVGDGNLRPQIERAIKQLGLNEYVILLGAKTNPYPYMKNCDLYVQTSFTEAYCLTVREARVFERFIVTTDFSSVQEQITDGKNGLIAEKTAESLAEKISAVLNNPEYYRVDPETLKEKPGDSDMERLYQYIEGSNI